MKKSKYFFDEHNVDYGIIRIIKDDCIKSLLDYIHFGQFDYHRIVYEYLNDNGELVEKKYRISPKVKYKFEKR